VLALAYFGSKFVLEDVLGRHWAECPILLRLLFCALAGLLILAAFFCRQRNRAHELERYRLRHRAGEEIARRGWRDAARASRRLIG